MPRTPAAINNHVDAPFSDEDKPQDNKITARVTVNLARPAHDALSNAVAMTGSSKTEVINKALQLYDMIIAAQNAGGGAWIQDTSRSEPVRARFF